MNEPPRTLSFSTPKPHSRAPNSSRFPENHPKFSNHRQSVKNEYEPATTHHHKPHGVAPEVDIQSFIQKCRQNDKKALQKDKLSLREQLWFSIQNTFRKIEQYGEQFYETIYRLLKGIRENKADRQETNLSDYLISSLNSNQQSIYNGHKIESVKNTIGSNIKSALTFMMDHQKDQFYVLNHDSIQRHYQESAKRSGKQKYEHYQSASHEKAHTKDHHTQQSKMSSKQEEFQKVYQSINSSRRNKTNLQASQAHRLYSVNPYGLSHQPKQSTFARNSVRPLENLNTSSPIDHEQSHSHSHSRSHSSYHNYSSWTNAKPQSLLLRAQPERSKIKNQYFSKRNSHIESILKGPVLDCLEMSNSHYRYSLTPSRAQSYTESKSHRLRQEQKYIIGINQQDIQCEWCQQFQLDKQTKFLELRSRSAQSSPLKVLCLVLCNKDRHLAVGTSQESVSILETDSFQQIGALALGFNPCCLSYLEDDNLLFVGTDSPDNSVYVYSTQNWTIASKINCHVAAVTSILPITNTTYIITGSFDRWIRIWNWSKLTQTPKENEQQFEGYKCQDICLSLLYLQKCGKIVIMGTTFDIPILNLDLGSDHLLSQDSPITSTSKVQCIQKCHNKNTQNIMVALQNGFIELYQVMNKERILRIDTAKDQIISSITISRLSKLNTPIVLFVSASANLYELNMESGRLIQRGNAGIGTGKTANFVRGIGPIMVVDKNQRIWWSCVNGITVGQFKIY